MDCDGCREVVSAGLDGESGPAEDAAAEAHLATCSPCRAFADRAAALTRRARLAPAEAGPDVVDAVLARVLGPELPLLVTCGCAASCGCGCQDGRPCRCHLGAA